MTDSHPLIEKAVFYGKKDSSFFAFVSLVCGVLYLVTEFVIKLIFYLGLLYKNSEPTWRARYKSARATSFHDQ